MLTTIKYTLLNPSSHPLMVLYSYFFSGEDEIPPELAWEAYGMGHILWLLSMGLVCFLIIYTARKLSPEKQDKLLKAIAIWIAIQEILKDILNYYAGTLQLEHLPLHFCGISIMFSLWYAFRPGKLNGAYIYGMSLPGAFCALIFPNWTQFPFWHFSAINSFTIHAELILFALIALFCGKLKPDIRQIPKMFAVLVLMAVPIYFLNKKWGTNFMFISDPSPGSPLIPLYNIFGDGYVIAAAVLLVIVWYIMFLPWYLKEIALKKNPKA